MPPAGDADVTGGRQPLEQLKLWKNSDFRGVT